MICNKKQLAEIVGKSERTLTEWQDGGMPIRSVGGRGLDNQYESAEVIEWLVQRALSGATRESSRERLDRVTADLREVDLARAIGSLVPAAEVQPMWERMIIAARTELVSLLAQLHAQVAAMCGPTVEIDSGLFDECAEKVLAKLSGHDPDADGDDSRRVSAMGAAAEHVDDGLHEPVSVLVDQGLSLAGKILGRSHALGAGDP